MEIANFLPPFDRGRPVHDRIDSLQNYIFQMRESLSYLLENLSPKENFNGAQMAGWSDSLLSPVYERVSRAERDIGSLRTRADKLEGSVDGLAARAEALEKGLGELGAAVGGLDDGFDARVDAILSGHGLI